MSELREDKIKPVLFCDFDGTICHDRYWRSLPSEIYEKVQSLLFGLDKIFINDWMRGKYTAEEANEYVSKKIDFPFEELWSLFVNDCKTMKVDSAVLNKLSALRNDYRTILLTGNMDSFSRFTVPALELNKYFDHVSNSYYEEKHKTDNNGEIFVEYCNKFKTNVSNSVLIDDSPKVCQIFAHLGGTVMQITPETDINYFLENSF
ncbi:MAG: HAD family hydrolase [Patescibacteria group bacterium]|jgi:FMN phosphatase YigB (HAD superfamily)